VLGKLIVVLNLVFAVNLNAQSAGVKKTGFSQDKKIVAVNSYGKPDNSRFTIFPNSGHGKFTARSPEFAEMVIFNSVGEAVYAKRLSKGNNEIDLSKYPKGIYFAQAGNVKTRIIIE